MPRLLAQIKTFRVGLCSMNRILLLLASERRALIDMGSAAAAAQALVLRAAREPLHLPRILLLRTIRLLRDLFGF